MGGRIDAIGLSVVMPEGPRRIPGRLSVARAPPAVRKLSGTYIECLHLSDSGRRVSLVPAQCSSHALCDRATVSLFLLTPDCGLGASSERPRIRQRPSLSARRQCRRHSPESHQLRAFGARVARVQRDSWEEALGPAAPVAGCACARFAVPQDRYPKAVLMPIRELMTSPSEKSPWRNRRSWTH